MSIEMAVDIFRSMIGEGIILILPLMVTAIVTGLLVSLFQSITSIQEQTLTFVPKLLAVGGVLVLSASWMMKSLVEFTISFIQRMPDMAP